MRIGSLLPSALALVFVSSVALDRAGADEWDHVAGPVEAKIVRIVDGDTLVVDAHPWPGHAVRVSVRLRGIDTPEKRSSCPDERLAADRAHGELERLLAAVATVELINVSGGKYYGRVLADLRAGSRDIATAMLDSGLARPYAGGKREKTLCPAS